MLKEKERSELERLREYEKKTVKPKPTGNCIYCKTVVVESMGRMPLYCSLECRQMVGKIKDAIRSCYPFMKDKQEQEMLKFLRDGIEYVFEAPNGILNAYYGLNRYKKKPYIETETSANEGEEVHF